jgi:hypothetical protein
MAKEPKTLMEAIEYFSDPEVAFEHAKELRFPDGVHCPTCGRTDVRFVATRKVWECKEAHAKRQFSAKLGTIMEDSPLPYKVWFAALWSIANDKNGISSYEFARMTGITQKSAWHVLHRCRLAMKVGGLDQMDGEVEVDETWIGGKVRNMHKAKRERNEKRSGSHWREKSIVQGMLQRTSDQALSHVRVRIVPDAGAKSLTRHIREEVKEGAAVMTDSLGAYVGLRQHYTHESVNHEAEEYVRGRVHVQGIENFWSLLKRTLGGTYVSVEPFHLARYLDEQAWRFNERKLTDGERFRKLASAIVGMRLTWKELTGYEDAGCGA